WATGRRVSPEESLIAKDWLSLFLERRHAFLRVVGAIGERGQFRFELKSFVERKVRSALNRATCELERRQAEARELPRKLQSGRHKAGFHDTVDEPDTLGLDGVERAAG